MGDESEPIFNYGRVMGRVIDWAKGVQTVIRRHPFVADASLALALAGAALISLAAVYRQLPANDTAFSHGFTFEVVTAMLAITIPLAWRRRYPFSVGIVIVVVFIVSRTVVHTLETNITAMVAWLMIYSVAVHGDRRYRTPVLALLYCAIMAELVRELFLTSNVPTLTSFFALFYNMVEFSLPWLLGAAMRSLRDRHRMLADQTVVLEMEREENARQAVFAERVRIARELHDVVAHHVSVIGVQAAGARRTMDRNPARAAEALSSIEDSSRRAVVELDRLLGFLRRVGESDDLAPQPGLAQLAELIAEARQTDLIVDLTIKGHARLLSPTLELSAYRVIQEALTNTRKHSSATVASVQLQYGTSELTVEVLDDGPEREIEEGGGQVGHGLIGMRERAALHGGHLRAGPRPSGGFAVKAFFPLNGDSS
jgi:signal transduction histidine kinase